jgi:hypothetical protein
MSLLMCCMSRCSSLFAYHTSHLTPSTSHPTPPQHTDHIASLQASMAARLQQLHDDHEAELQQQHKDDVADMLKQVGWQWT